MQSRIQLCRTTDVAKCAALKIETRGLALAVFNVDGEFFVIDDAELSNSVKDLLSGDSAPMGP